MTVEIDIHLGEGPVQAIPVPATSVDITLLTGDGYLCGWALRDATGSGIGETEGQVVAPAAGATIATTPALAAGTYDVNWTVGLLGAAAAGDADNFEILHNAVVIAHSQNAGVAGQYPQPQFHVTVAQGDTISVKAIGAGTAGVTYLATIGLSATDVPTAVVELQDGNNPLGESAPLPGSADVQNFGQEGIRIRNQILLHVVSGTVTGAVYARYYC